MLATYASVALGSDALSGVSGLAIDGRQINQEAQLIRGANPLLFPRGNRSRLISFSINLAFGTLAEAEAFVHEHLDELPTSGDLVFTTADASTYTYAAAVLDSCKPTYRGLSVQIDYAFRATTVASA